MRIRVREFATAIILSTMLSGWTAGLAQVGTPEATTNSQSSISSDSLHRLPAGEPGQVSVIAVGVYPQLAISIPILIRNNTEAPVHNLRLKAELFDKEGNLVGVETESYGVYPVVLNPGEVALTTIQPDRRRLPSEVEFSFSVSYDEDLGSRGRYITTVAFNDVTLTDGRILGRVVNPIDRDIEDVWLLATCIDADGVPVNFDVSSPGTNGTDRLIRAGDLSTFQVDIHGEPCEGYLVTGYARIL